MSKKDLIEVAAGREKADLVLKNAQILDVFCRRIISGDIAIYQGKLPESAHTTVKSNTTSAAHS